MNEQLKIDPAMEAIDASCRVPLLALFGGAALWLVVGLALALLASLNFHMPWMFGDHAWLTYGRVQPAANDAILYGFAIPAALGVALWIFARLGETELALPLAPVIAASSGSEQSRSVYIDKGESDGIRPDMAVITADGIVGKVLHAYPSTSQVLLINDQSSGVGAILEKSRLQGILKGTSAGEVVLEKVMSDESVPVGEMVLTSGGDGIFPKGLLVGRVTKAGAGSDLFLNIRVRPAADLGRLEEVLVVTKIDERQALPEPTGAARAVDILAERLPGVPSKPENAEKGGGAAPGATVPASTSAGSEAKPKAVSPPASASGGATAVRKTATSSPGAGSGSSGATDATKTPPKPVKAVVEPKPQPAVEDSPH